MSTPSPLPAKVLNFRGRKTAAEIKISEEYVLQEASKTRCPICTHRVDLLIQGLPNGHRPAFYVCWDCREVFQIGQGRVERE